MVSMHGTQTLLAFSTKILSKIVAIQYKLKIISKE